MPLSGGYGPVRGLLFKLEVVEGFHAMIRKTLRATQSATLQIMLPTPNPIHQGASVPIGTGFLVSPEGWLVTAAHVVADPTGKSPRSDLNNIAMVNKSSGRDAVFVPRGSSTLECFLPELDFALLKISPVGPSGPTPFIEISDRWLEEGEPVYSFGFPLPEYNMLPFGVANVNLSLNSRTTSAIISGIEEPFYAIDKALTFGNSGGPIVSAETGKVAAFCSKYQQVKIPQPNLILNQTTMLNISIPSLYSYVVSISLPVIQAEFAKRGIILPLSTTPEPVVEN
jgi:serine protease Do